MEEGDFTYLLFGEVWWMITRGLIDRNSPITCEPKVEVLWLEAGPPLKEGVALGGRVLGVAANLQLRLPKLKNDPAP